MGLHKYTQTEFDALPIINGQRQCPTGDYTNVKTFGARCRFGEGCIFGEGCSFGKWCRFGEGCRFGDGCSFGEWCRFGEWCIFGARCRFGEGCIFGEGCSFGKWCSFENGHVTRTRNPFFACDRIGSENRKTYFFDFADGIYVRAGCFFGSEADFTAKVHADGDDHKTRVYMMALELAKLHLLGGAK